MWYYNDRRGADERLPPFGLENYSVYLGEGLGRSNFFLPFGNEITLLATILKIVDKTDDRNDECAKRKKLSVSNHTNPPSLLGFPLGKLAKGGPSAVGGSPFRAVRPWLF